MKLWFADESIPFGRTRQGFITRVRFGLRRPRPSHNTHGQSIDGIGIPHIWYK